MIQLVGGGPEDGKRIKDEMGLTIYRVPMGMARGIEMYQSPPPDVVPESNLLIGVYKRGRLQPGGEHVMIWAGQQRA
jgi:hypothetical protein